MTTLFLSALSGVLNQYLNLNPDAIHRFKRLKDKTICITLLPFHSRLFCLFSEKGVKVSSTSINEADVNIVGTPWQLFNVMKSKKNRQAYFVDDLTIEGDAQIADEMMHLFDEVQIDWENELSHFFGDVPAYHLTHGLGRLGRWLQQVEEKLSQDVDDYIHEEALWLPQKENLHSFLDDIDHLRMETDLVEARIKQLMVSVANEEGKL